MRHVWLNQAFQSVELEHRRELGGFLDRHPHPLSGYTFAALAFWRQTFEYRWAFCAGRTLVISCVLEPEMNRHMLQPIGPVDGECIGQILRGARELPYRLQIVGVEKRFLEQNPDFVAHFDVALWREWSNYVYLAEDLATLAGRRYSKKRNLIAQARQLYRWTVEPLDEANVADALRVLVELHAEEQWEATASLRAELAALETTLSLFGALEQDGILIRVDGRAVAFSIFEANSPDTAVIHFERALRSYKGLYQVANQEVAKVIAGRGFRFINREEDLGNEGLRQAKLSYYPVEIVDSYTLTLK